MVVETCTCKQVVVVVETCTCKVVMGEVGISWGVEEKSKYIYQ